MSARVEIESSGVELQGELFPAELRDLLADLHAGFAPRRREILAARGTRQQALRAGQRPAFLEETREIREADWTVADAPADLECRWAEITGPVDRKMMINALNSGAKVFMADLEDALAPSWSNVIDGHLNLRDAVRRKLDFVQEDTGKSYELAEDIATLVVRPRGWHLEERHVRVDGEPISASLFDFATCFFHNAREALDRGSGPYFYLPKLESHREARLWNDVFVWAQARLGIPRGTIRATVLIETLLAAFEMEEILYELREHSAGLNAGRWDYIFSAIKKLAHEDVILPDRDQITMTVPFMRAYTELLVRSCHKRGAHAIGGMAAFIPSRRDPEVNAVALRKVREDKEREAADGFDGSWVAHPDLVPIALEVFRERTGGAPHQKARLREDVRITAEELADLEIPGGTVTLDGVRKNISVGIRYLAAWLQGLGAVAIDNLMEDAATAEISRAQLWQWIHRGAELADGGDHPRVSPELYRRVRDEEVAKLGGREGAVGAATSLLDDLVLQETFEEFLTLRAYEQL